MPKISKLIGYNGKSPPKLVKTNETCYIAKSEDKSKPSIVVSALVTIKMVESKEIEVYGYLSSTPMLPLQHFS